MNRTSPLALMLIALALLCLFCSPSMAGSVWLEKEGVFRLVRAPKEGDLGSVIGDVETKAVCGCNSQNSTDNVVPAITWPIATGFARDLIADCSSTADHADAAADLCFEASAPYANNNHNYIDTCFDMILDATADQCPNGKSYAWSKANGDATVPIGRLETVTLDDLLDLNFKLQTKNVWKLNRNHLEAVSKETDKDKTSCHDPIVMSFYEEQTGTYFENTLLTMDAEVSGHADATFDFSGDVASEGIRLYAPEDGLSNITLTADFPGDWITLSPGAFSVSLIDGQFTATGVLAGLAWDFVYGPQGGILEATLAPEYVPGLDVEGTVDTSAWTVGYDYAGRFEEGLWAETWDSAVPEPATIALLALGGLAVLKRRRTA